MGGLFDGPRGEQLRTAIFVLAWLLVAFVAVEVAGAASGLRYIGAGVAATNTISVSGHGEATGVPDIATFSFSVVSDKSTVAAAQADATAKANALTDYLTSAGVDTKDIQTSDYSVSPQYSYSQSVCPAIAPANGATPVYCPPSKQTLTGYEVRQTTTVKVRDTSKAGDLLSGVGSKGATEVSGLNFTFDQPDTLQTQARTAAITDAKQKAQVLAKELGVSLVSITSFSDSSGSRGPVPLYEAASTGSSNATSPEISAGENDVTDDVSITYEIR